MTLRVTFGIDPGLTGAIAVLVDGEPAAVYDMPTLKRGDWNEVDGQRLASIIRGTRTLHAGAYFSGCIEKVGARPGDGGTSAFRFGESSGKTKAVLEALAVPYTLVVPAVWKRYYGLLKAEKDASRQLALKRFPSVADTMQRKKDDGRAEALLIGLYHDSLHVPSEVRAA